MCYASYMGKQTKTPWWKHAIIYQIYPRSFNDSNGDGIGDIPGIIQKLDYLCDLGVDALWLSPVYMSPNKDYGYDVANYRDINPEYGTLDDMKELIAEAGKRKIKIIMDLVVNHTSDMHPWFLSARYPDSPYRDYYIWRSPRTTNHKSSYPNNWTSIFTGPAWKKDKVSGDYYLHLFTASQPDLNYRNPAVVGEVKEIMSYWLDLGVAGFRCDVINLLYKKAFFDGKKRLLGNGVGEEFYISAEGTHAVLQSFHRDVLGPRKAYTVGELYKGSLPEAKRFTAGSELDTVFNFDHVQRSIAASSIKQLKDGLIKWQKGLDWNTVFLENHDQPRSVSVYGNTAFYHEESAKMLATLILTLRGTPFIYQGQEIGMTNRRFSSVRQAKDPMAKMVYQIITRSHGPKWLATKVGLITNRDNSRTPMQWSGDQHAGFTTGKPWIAVNQNYRRISVAASEQNNYSILNYYRYLLKIRKENLTLIDGTISFRNEKKGVMVYERRSDDDRLVIVLNLTARKQQTQTAVTGEIYVNTTGRTGRLNNEIIQLKPYEAIIIKSTKG